MDNFLTEKALLSLSAMEFFILTVVGFSFLYFSFTTIGYFLFSGKRFQRYQTKEYRTNQVRTEVKRSFVSIFMFGVLAFPMHWGLQTGFFKLNFIFQWSVFLLELFILFLWNEVYFYLNHRLFHTKALYKYHADHHYSHVPSPFSAYSFHWSEGLLLGAVMPIALFFHDFQVYSILMLPPMSIIMNVLGHSNIDFFPSKSVSSIFSFSKRHSLHHKIPHTNFGFFLPYLDRLLGTASADHDSK